ncbi:MAG TPA: NifU family protein [Polyangiaceae bacterium]|nr:NifU family protein [Polyangiaceae bacterium]
MAQRSPEVTDVLRRVLEPLIRADGGALYVIEAASDRVTLHLTGRFSGCPGNALLTRRVIAPLLARVAPNAKITVTSGRLLPDGAERLTPSA